MSEEKPAAPPVSVDGMCAHEDIALSTPVDWAQFPKLARIFQERPRVNVYWLELARLAFDLTADMHKRWAKEAEEAGIERGRALGAREALGVIESERDTWAGVNSIAFEMLDQLLKTVEARSARVPK